jgi:hypothetical protein
LISYLLAFRLLLSPPVNPPRFGGTFIGAIVAEDGIVLGADSRSTFIDSAGRPMGYVDGIQKIYVGPTTGVAVSGLTSLDGELFNSFVDRNLFLLQRPADEVLFGFAVWLPYKNSVGVMLLSGGFSNGKPMVCARSVFQPQSCQNEGSITNKPAPSLEAWVSRLKAPPKAAAAAEALKKAIEESAASDITVGGPISLVQVRHDGLPIWLENPPGTTTWHTICDIVRDHRASRIKIVPTGSSSDLDHYLASTCR